MPIEKSAACGVVEKPRQQQAAEKFEGGFPPQSHDKGSCVTDNTAMCGLPFVRRRASPDDHSLSRRPLTLLPVKL